MSEKTKPGPETRQKAVDALCDSFARDEIEIDELEKRLELVHEAETEAELSLIMADLPAPPVPAPVTAPVPGKRGGAASMAGHRRKVLARQARQMEARPPGLQRNLSAAV